MTYFTIALLAIIGIQALIIFGMGYLMYRGFKALAHLAQQVLGKVH